MEENSNTVLEGAGGQTLAAPAAANEGQGSGKNFVKKRKGRLTKREAEEWNALLKQKAPTPYEPDGREAAYDEACEEEECRKLIGKFAQESAKRGGGDIGGIVDRYETIVLELLAVRYPGADGKPYSLATVLLKECETGSALKELLVSLRVWIKAFVLRYHIYKEPHNTWVMRGSDVRAIKTLRGHSVSESMMEALAVEYVRDCKGLTEFLSGVFKHWRKIFEPRSLLRVKLLTQQCASNVPHHQIAQLLEKADAIPKGAAVPTANGYASLRSRIKKYRSRDQKEALLRKVTRNQTPSDKTVKADA